jgi:O-antigen/teichoic acid export membrane protein
MFEGNFFNRFLMFRKVYSTKINAAANFAGSIWTALLGLIFVPVYLNYIGIEAYGLIGIFNSFLAFIVLLDFGLSPTLNRELARLSADDTHAQEMRDTKTTLEKLNWISAAFVALLFFVLAPLIANFWITPKGLSIETVTHALFIMSVTIAVQISVNFYTGGLMGMQKQVLLNLINIICATLRFVGAFLVLAFYSPTIKAFLVWQALVVFLQAVIMAAALKIGLPETPRKGKYQKDLLRKIGRFAAGMTGITVVSLILTQTDKIILSKMLSLETFGYYILAVTVATMAINVVINSISHAAFPQFSKLVSTGNNAALSFFYHHTCQIASVFLFPIIVILALFSYEILLVWTRSETIAANTYVLLSLITVGTGINSLMWLPYFLQLAHGWTRLVFYVNIASIIILIPVMSYGIYHYGAIGGAVGWLALNASSFLITGQLMHRKILKGEAWKWYFEDLLLPFSGAFLVALAGKYFFSSNNTRFEITLKLSLILMATFITAVLLTKATRSYFKFGKKTILE